MSRRRTPPTSVLLMIIAVDILSGGILACHPAEYQVGNECCPKCPAGHRVKTDCTEFRITSCLLCRDGTYVDRLCGLKDCITCTTCDSDSGLTIKRSCTVTSNTVCKALDGLFCVAFKEGSCEAAVKHRSCKPGQYISQKGTDSTDTECSDCREGTFSNGTTLLCRPHTNCEDSNLQLIKAGTALVDAECGESGLNAAGLAAISLVVVVIFIVIGVGVGIFSLKQKHLLKGRLKNAKRHNTNKPSTSEDDEPLALSPIEHSHSEHHQISVLHVTEENLLPQKQNDKLLSFQTECKA